jgi:hypothetical protein
MVCEGPSESEGFCQEGLATQSREGRFGCSGPDWLLHLINSVDEEGRAKLLLLLWRAWFQRNDVMHGQGTVTALWSALKAMRVR